MVIELRAIKYEERLEVLGLKTLKTRQVRGELIQKSKSKKIIVFIWNFTIIYKNWKKLKNKRCFNEFK